MPRTTLVHTLFRHLIPQRNMPSFTKLLINGIQGIQFGIQSKNTWKSKVLADQELGNPNKTKRAEKKKKRDMQSIVRG